MKKTILVTGASSGFGLLIASKLHEAGHTVIGTSRNPDKHQSKVPFKLLQLDLDDDKSIESFASRLFSQISQLDVLINNAGYLLAGLAEQRGRLSVLPAPAGSRRRGVMNVSGASASRPRTPGWETPSLKPKCSCPQVARQRLTALEVHDVEPVQADEDLVRQSMETAWRHGSPQSRRKKNRGRP